MPFSFQNQSSNYIHISLPEGLLREDRRLRPGWREKDISLLLRFELPSLQTQLLYLNSQKWKPVFSQKREKCHSSLPGARTVPQMYSSKGAKT